MLYQYPAPPDEKCGLEAIAGATSVASCCCTRLKSLLHNRKSLRLSVSAVKTYRVGNPQPALWQEKVLVFVRK